MRSAQRPTRTKETGPVHDTREEHPSYAMIGASRVSSHPGRALFGSDFTHQHYITVTIRKASLRRGLSNDWFSGEEELIEVALSEAQWATFLSTLNMGQGTPCTLSWMPGEGYMPEIVNDLNRQAQSREEIDAHMKDGLDYIDAVIARGKLSKDDLRNLETAKMKIKESSPWVTSKFDEHAEKTVEKAKIEIEAYLNSAINRAGITALGGTPSPILLPDPEDGA